ncbi:YczE/YyaS/YitT family protein [Brachybacterium sacelli]|nr:hypothetical protein [Brachybacterium sacelli]
MGPREQLRAGNLARRIPQLLVGLIGYGACVMLLVESGLGAASWNVLAEGVAENTGLSFGWTTNLIAAVVLLAWIPLREPPGIGTVLNVMIVGAAADATAALLPDLDSLGARIVAFVVGLVGFAFFDALYLGAQFGSGPRDGLMTGLVHMTGKPVAAVRTGLDVVVALVGWSIGGTLGLGTILISLCTGSLVGAVLPWVTVRVEHNGPPTDCRQVDCDPTRATATMIDDPRGWPHRKAWGASGIFRATDDER